jgi:NAD(P)-dependent dehydrogenase (short-subunit alcohol dehydrogenase family)
MNKRSFFRDKVVVITGSSRGIGKATAIQMGEAGAKVVLNSRSSLPLSKTKQELINGNIDCFSVQSDVSSEEGARRLIEESVNHYGKIDILINNAGIAVRGLFTETFPDTWNNILRSNIVSCLFPTWYALPWLKETRGSIVFISSIGGRAGLPGHGAYSFTKMPFTSLAQTLDIELQPYGVHVGIIYVGFTLNDPDKTITDGAGTETILKSRKGIPLMKPEKVAGKIMDLIIKRKRSKVISAMGHFQTIFYSCPVIRRMIMRNMLKRYKNLYKEN